MDKTKKSEYLEELSPKEKDGLAQVLVEFEKYKLVIATLLACKGADGISRVSQKEVAKRLGMSAMLVSKCIKRLERTDRCVEIVGPGKYIVHHTDLNSKGPFRLFCRFLEEAEERSEWYRMKRIEQAKILGCTVEEIRMIYGYLSIYTSAINS